jgi:hypothetical protein
MFEGVGVRMEGGCAPRDPKGEGRIANEIDCGEGHLYRLRFEDGIADQFRDLGNYGVSQGFKSVCPMGNPISHSTHGGFSAPDSGDTTMESINCLPLDKRRWIDGFERLPLSLSSPACGVGHSARATSRSKFGNLAFAVFSVKFAAIALQLRGVGHNPDSVPAVRCANVGSWYAVPLRIIPERGQGSENVCKPSTKQCCDVFQDNVSGCQFANETGDFVKQAASLAFKACTFSGETNVLAGEPSCDDINGNSIGSKLLCGKLSHVSVAGHVWPVLCEDFARELFDFTECDGFKSACSFKAKAETSYSREKIKDAQLTHTTPPLSLTATNAHKAGRRS